MVLWFHANTCQQNWQHMLIQGSQLLLRPVAITRISYAYFPHFYGFVFLSTFVIILSLTSVTVCLHTYFPFLFCYDEGITFISEDKLKGALCAMNILHSAYRSTQEWLKNHICQQNTKWAKKTAVAYEGDISSSVTWLSNIRFYIFWFKRGPASQASLETLLWTRSRYADHPTCFAKFAW